MDLGQLSAMDSTVGIFHKVVMALTKQKVSLPFALGIQTKTDDQQQQIGRLRKIKNAIFDTVNKLRKRNGYNVVLTKLLDNTQIQNATSLTSFRDELCLLSNTNFYSYSSTIDKWTDKGSIFSAFPTSTPIIRNNREQKNLDALSQEQLNVYVYEDDTGVRATIKDSDSGNVLLNNFLISATGTLPKVASITNSVHIFFVDGTDIKFRKINLLNPSSVESEVTMVSDLNATDKKYDVKGFTDKIVAAYNSSTVPKALALNEDATTSSVINFTGFSASKALSVEADDDNRVLVSFSDGIDVYFSVLPLNLGGFLLTPTSIETTSDVLNVTATNHSSGDYTLFYEIPTASSKNYSIRKNTCSLSGTVGTAETIVNSLGLASKVFKYNSQLYVTGLHSSEFQASYFVLDSSGNVLVRISPNLGGTLITENGLPKVELIDTKKYLIPSQIKGQTVTDEGTFYSLLGVNSTELEFDIQSPYQNDSLGNNLHITGGVLKMYDGNCIVEHNFHLFPEDLTAGSTATVGGLLDDGTYQYVAVYAWTDSYGQIHRSAPSIPLSVTLSGGTTTQTQDIVVPSLRLTEKEDVIIELYRTENVGGIFYKITSTTSPVYNDKTVDTITITDDSVSDNSLISREILYTTGGILENIAAPASRIVESFNDRVFLAGLEDENKVVFSKIRDEGEPVEFNDTLYKIVNDEGGRITAMHVMDEKLVIFKEDALYFISGDGPNDLGEQDTFIEPERISSEIGCQNRDSVVLTPLGLMFKSRKGIYLLNRGLSLQYVGDEVEEFNDLTVTSAKVVPEDNQVRFTTLEGDCLVYNYFVDQWATFDNHRALSAAVVNEQYYYMRADGVVYAENNDTFTDRGSSVDMTLESGWISFAGVQGFQRVYRLFLLSEFKSKHKLRIRIAYDFNEAFTQEVVIDTDDFASETAYGNESPYGNGSPYGGTGNVHQIRVDLKRQKCQAIKFRIEEIQDSTLGEGLNVSNILFEVGAKKGANKIDTGRKYGTNS